MMFAPAGRVSVGQRRPMGSPEHPQPPQPENIGPLPPELTEFLRGQDVACLMQETSEGTAYVVKLPGREIESLRGRIPIAVRYELYRQPTAPVIRTLLYLYDQPTTPLALETFTNIADPEQHNALAALTSQQTFTMLFYDEQVHHRLTKVIPQTNPTEILRVLEAAEELLRRIPAEQFDFDLAREVVLRNTRL